MSKAGKRLIKTARRMVAYARGADAGFVAHAPDRVDVKAIRREQKLTQHAFASRYGFSIDALQEWEQGRRQPESTARILLTVIAHEPEAVTRALAH